MASVLIIDDDIAAGQLLADLLASHRHAVRLVTARDPETVASLSASADLLLINIGHGGTRGWDLFNHLKQTNPSFPAMVYYLREWRPSEARWVVRAVDEVLCTARKRLKSTPIS